MAYHTKNPDLMKEKKNVRKKEWTKDQSTNDDENECMLRLKYYYMSRRHTIHAHGMHMFFYTSTLIKCGQLQFRSTLATVYLMSLSIWSKFILAFWY